MNKSRNDTEAGFRSICDSGKFIADSMNIVENVKKDLATSNKAPSEITKDLHKLRNALRGLHRKSKQRLALNLGDIFGEPGLDVIAKLDKALDHNIPNLNMRSRSAVVGSVYSLFIDHGLPINRSKSGPLATYFEFMSEATGFPWPVEQLTRDTCKMLKEGWFTS